MSLYQVLRNRVFWSRVLTVVGIVTLSVLILTNADRLRALSGYGYAGVFILSALTNATIIIPAPSWIIPIAAATSLDPFWVGIVAGTGQTVGELTGYIAGASGKIIVEDRQRYERLSSLANRYGLWAFTVLAFIPNPVFDLAGITAGALGISVIRFFFAAWIGKTARAILLAYGGYGILGRWFGV